METTSGLPGQLKPMRAKPMNVQPPANGGVQAAPNVPDAKKADYERSMAMLFTLTHERDEANKAVADRDQQIAVNRIEIEGLRAELEILRTSNQGYQRERDEAIRREARSTARLEAVADVVLSQIRSRGEEDDAA